jgi:hypothetical protein
MLFLKKIKKFVCYETLYISSIFVLYIFPSFIGIYYLGFNSRTITAFLLPAWAVFSFFFVFSLCKTLFSKIDIKLLELKTTEKMIYGIFFSYLVFFLLLCITCKKVPLLSSLLGDTQENIYNYRVAFDLTRSGWEKILVYFYVFYSSLVCPLIIIVLFDNKIKYRNIIFIVFCFTLMFSLAKTLCFKAFIPLIFYYLFSKKKDFSKAFFFFLSCLFIVFITTFFFFAGPKKLYNLMHSFPIERNEKHLSSDTFQKSSATPSIQNKKHFILINKDINGFIKIENFIFERSSPFLFMLNRLLWTPYATLYAYLGFRSEIMQNKNVSIIRTIRPLSIILGKKYFPYDHFVFNYQYSLYENGSQKLSSQFIGINAAPYFVETYAKYGWLVFIFSSLFIAIFFYFVVCHGSDLAKTFFSMCLLLMITNPLVTVLTNAVPLVVFLLFFDIKISKNGKSHSSMKHNTD